MMDLNYGTVALNPEDLESNPTTPDVVDLVSNQSWALRPVTVGTHPSVQYTHGPEMISNSISTKTSTLLKLNIAVLLFLRT